MKKLILQHWTGEMRELEHLSSANISKYAEEVNADYRLLRGDVFRPGITAPCQKIYMLNEEFDKYDMVVMLDCDMFTRKGMEEDVFNDATGFGRHTAIQDKLVENLCKRFPNLGNVNYPYWGGSIYRLPVDLRQRLRVHLKDEEVVKFSGNYEDEGIMHRLAVLSKLEITNDTYLPGSHWNHGSFEDGVEDAAIIHIRTKIKQGGSKRPKIENYKGLVERGIIEK